MIHKISQMCDKVNVIYEKSMHLRRLKYDTPKDQQNKNIEKDTVADSNHEFASLMHV